MVEGRKGGCHLVRYYDKKTSKVLVKVIIAKSVKEENANVVADIFLDYCSTKSINLKENLIMANRDHASTLCGLKAGDIVRLTEKAPNLRVIFPFQTAPYWWGRCDHFSLLCLLPDTESSKV